jgi:hypothetical protein
MKKLFSHSVGAIIVLISLSIPDTARGAAAKWDYLRHPVSVTENRTASDPAIGLSAASAFDGYGALGSMPSCARAWLQKAVPTDRNPLACEIDYGAPTLVTALVHYFYVPGSRDLRFTSPAPSAMKKVRISTRNEDGSWQEITNLADLPDGCPQVIPTGATKPSRYWRLEILELAPGAEFLCTYELETYTGGIPKITPAGGTETNPLLEFTDYVRQHTPSKTFSPGRLFLADRDPHTLGLHTQGVADSFNGELCLLIDGKPASFAAVGDNRWQIGAGAGQVLLEGEPTALGLLLKLRFTVPEATPVKYHRAALQISAPGTQLYYMPAYAWSRSPIDTMVPSCNVQTRMAALGFPGSMLCLLPGTDRGSIGFGGGAVRNDLLLGPEATPVLLAALPGDWWKSYRFAVDEVYGFGEPRQTVPVSEMQYGISRYLLADDIWEPTLGTVKSWPQRDAYTKVLGYFDAFNFYGATFSIPAYWARFVMNGDPLARQRCLSIVRWLCRSGVRMAEGPARGAFFSGQRFPTTEPVRLDRRGCTQASTEILTSQATGSALWSLLFYRHVTEENDPEINRVIDEGAQWLLTTQTQEGGWPYGHTIDGKTAAGAPSGGSIWNIRALWRLGKETGQAKYLGAADRGKLWYLKTFVEPHHYHGYWEDVGPNSREGYEAAVAAVAFAEMGEKQAVVDCARDAMQWVFTRRIEPREATCSAGLVAEQTGWPPAAYCNPMMALAAYSAWQASGDADWRPFAMIPKATGWWYKPDSGAMVWIVDALQMAPLVGPAWESWWNDWCIAQSGTLMLRWLVREMNRRFAGNGALDEETLKGNVLGEDVHAWAPQGGLQPILPQHGQVNWMGLRSARTVRVVFMNFAEDAPARCELNSRSVQGASLLPRTIHIISGGKVSSQAWDGQAPVIVPRDGAAVLVWEVFR